MYRIFSTKVGMHHKLRCNSEQFGPCQCCWEFGQQDAAIIYFTFYGFATIVIKRCLSLQKFKMCEFKDTTNGLEMKMLENITT